MGNIFANKKAVKDEKVEDDFIGGGGVLDTDIYPGTIKYAYIGKAPKSEARNCTLCVVVNGKEVTRQVWMTNKAGDVTYTKDGETHNLPGYNQINSLAMMLLSKEIGDCEVEEKTLKLYDFDARKEVPQAVECFVELHGKDLQVAIQRQTIDKTEKNDSTGDYEPTGETRDVNEFIKFFPEDKLATLSEIAEFIKGLGGTFDDVMSDGDLQKAIDNMPDEPGAYATKWLEKNRGQTYDRSTGKKEGKSFGGSKSSDGGSKSSGAKKSLFDD